MGQATTESAGFRRIWRTMALERRHRTPSRQIQSTVDTGILDEFHQGLLHPKRIARLDMRIPSARRESRSHLARSLRRRCWSTLAGSFGLTVVTSALMGVECVVATEAYVPLPLFLSFIHRKKRLAWAPASPRSCLGRTIARRARRARGGAIPQGARSVSSAITTTSSSGRLRIRSVGKRGGESRSGDRQWRSARWARHGESMSANQPLL